MLIEKLVLAAAASAGAAGLYMWKEAFRNEVKETVIEDPCFPEKAPLALFFISDIHRRLVHPSVVKKVQKRAAFVLIGGDLFEGGVPAARIEENIKRLSAIGPLYFVPGNNDYELTLEAVLPIFARWNVTVLKNRSVPLGGHVYLLGIDDLSKGKSDKKALFHGVPADAYKILCSHNPAFKRALLPEDNISLFLSGHTHGGQIRLGRWGLYEKGGWQHDGGFPLLVSNGYGTTGVPLRFGARAETHLITIQQKETIEIVRR